MSGLGWHYLTKWDKRTILHGVERGTACGGPYHVELQPTDRCDMDCFFCGARFHRGNDELSLEEVNAIIKSMRRSGTRSVGLNGGGEPLFHTQAPRIIALLNKEHIPIANITTNGTHLNGHLAEILLEGDCDQVIVSLNTGDEKSYAMMMGTDPDTFHLVLDNIRKFLEARRKRRAAKPILILHFLVYKDNYRTIPAMYRLALSLGVDRILFHGIALLKPEQRMRPEETEEMMRLYEQVVREDEYRRVKNISSLEQNISMWVDDIDKRIGSERAQTALWHRIGRLLQRRDLSWREKWQHHRYMKRKRMAIDTLRRLDDSCLMPWYAMIIRPDGTVPVCCVFQQKILDSIKVHPLDEIWNGEHFQRVRNQLRRIMEEGHAWEYNPETDRDIELMCAPMRGNDCFMRNFYFCLDIPFLHRLHRCIGRVRRNE